MFRFRKKRKRGVNQNNLIKIDCGETGAIMQNEGPELLAPISSSDSSRPSTLTVQRSKMGIFDLSPMEWIPFRHKGKPSIEPDKDVVNAQRIKEHGLFIDNLTRTQFAMDICQQILRFRATNGSYDVDPTSLLDHRLQFNPTTAQTYILNYKEWHECQRKNFFDNPKLSMYGKNFYRVPKTDLYQLYIDCIHGIKGARDRGNKMVADKEHVEPYKSTETKRFPACSMYEGPGGEAYAVGHRKESNSKNSRNFSFANTSRRPQTATSSETRPRYDDTNYHRGERERRSRPRDRTPPFRPHHDSLRSTTSNDSRKRRYEKDHPDRESEQRSRPRVHSIPRTTKQLDELELGELALTPETNNDADDISEDEHWDSPTNPITANKTDHKGSEDINKTPELIKMQGANTADVEYLSNYTELTPTPPLVDLTDETDLTSSDIRIQSPLKVEEPVLGPNGSFVVRRRRVEPELDLLPAAKFIQILRKSQSIEPEIAEETQQLSPNGTPNSDTSISSTGSQQARQSHSPLRRSSANSGIALTKESLELDNFSNISDDSNDTTFIPQPRAELIQNKRVEQSQTISNNGDVSSSGSSVNSITLACAGEPSDSGNIVPPVQSQQDNPAPPPNNPEAIPSQPQTTGQVQQPVMAELQASVNASTSQFSRRNQIMEGTTASEIPPVVEEDSGEGIVFDYNHKKGNGRSVAQTKTIPPGQRLANPFATTYPQPVPAPPAPPTPLTPLMFPLPPVSPNDVLRPSIYNGIGGYTIPVNNINPYPSGSNPPPPTEQVHPIVCDPRLNRNIIYQNDPRSRVNPVTSWHSSGTQDNRLLQTMTRSDSGQSTNTPNSVMGRQSSKTVGFQGFQIPRPSEPLPDAHELDGPQRSATMTLNMSSSSHLVPASQFFPSQLASHVNPTPGPVSPINARFSGLDQDPLAHLVDKYPSRSNNLTTPEEYMETPADVGSNRRTSAQHRVPSPPQRTNERERERSVPGSHSSRSSSRWSPLRSRSTSGDKGTMQSHSTGKGDHAAGKRARSRSRDCGHPSKRNKDYSSTKQIENGGYTNDHYSIDRGVSRNPNPTADGGKERFDTNSGKTNGSSSSIPKSNQRVAATRSTSFSEALSGCGVRTSRPAKLPASRRPSTNVSHGESSKSPVDRVRHSSDKLVSNTATATEAASAREDEAIPNKRSTPNKRTSHAATAAPLNASSKVVPSKLDAKPKDACKRPNGSHSRPSTGTSVPPITQTTRSCNKIIQEGKKVSEELTSRASEGATPLAKSKPTARVIASTATSKSMQKPNDTQLNKRQPNSTNQVPSKKPASNNDCSTPARNVVVKEVQRSDSAEPVPKKPRLEPSTKEKIPQKSGPTKSGKTGHNNAGVLSTKGRNVIPEAAISSKPRGLTPPNCAVVQVGETGLVSDNSSKSNEQSTPNPDEVISNETDIIPGLGDSTNSSIGANTSWLSNSSIVSPNPTENVRETVVLNDENKNSSNDTGTEYPILPIPEPTANVSDTGNDRVDKLAEADEESDEEGRIKIRQDLFEASELFGQDEELDDGNGSAKVTRPRATTVTNTTEYIPKAMPLDLSGEVSSCPLVVPSGYNTTATLNIPGRPSGNNTEETTPIASVINAVGSSESQRQQPSVSLISPQVTVKEEPESAAEKPESLSTESQSTQSSKEPQGSESSASGGEHQGSNHDVQTRPDPIASALNTTLNSVEGSSGSDESVGVDTNTADVKPAVSSSTTTTIPANNQVADQTTSDHSSSTINDGSTAVVNENNTIGEKSESPSPPVAQSGTKRSGCSNSSRIDRRIDTIKTSVNAALPGLMNWCSTPSNVSRDDHLADITPVLQQISNIYQQVDLANIALVLRSDDIPEDNTERVNQTLSTENLASYFINLVQVQELLAISERHSLPLQVIEYRITRILKHYCLNEKKTPESAFANIFNYIGIKLKKNPDSIDLKSWSSQKSTAAVDHIMNFSDKIDVSSVLREHETVGLDGFKRLINSIARAKERRKDGRGNGDVVNPPVAPVAPVVPESVLSQNNNDDVEIIEEVIKGTNEK